MPALWPRVRNDDGLTLLEVLAMVAVMGIGLVVTLPIVIDLSGSVSNDVAHLSQVTSARFSDEYVSAAGASTLEDTGHTYAVLNGRTLAVLLKR